MARGQILYSYSRSKTPGIVIRTIGRIYVRCNLYISAIYIYCACNMIHIAIAGTQYVYCARKLTQCIYCAWAVRSMYIARMRLRNMYIAYTYRRNIHILRAICILRGQGTQFALALSIFTIFQIHGGFRFSRLFSAVQPRVLRPRGGRPPLAVRAILEWPPLSDQCCGESDEIRL